MVKMAKDLSAGVVLIAAMTSILIGMMLFGRKLLIMYSASRFCPLLKDAANTEKVIPRAWINEAGDNVTEDLKRYVRPLIMGEVNVPFSGGLPAYVALNQVPVEKKLPDFQGK